MRPAVLLGDPSCFWIKAGTNPHTRDLWGRRKRVDLPKAIAQWNWFKSTLEHHGVKVSVLPADRERPGLVFPANAGFRHGDTFYLSNLNPSRSGEEEIYRRFLTEWGLTVRDFPLSGPFEGEADFIPVGDPSGDPSKVAYLFTYGRIERPHGVPRLGIPPYRRITGFRSDRRILSALQGIVHPREVLPLELIDEAHYHGDTVLGTFGSHQEFLLVYFNALSAESQAALKRRFGDRVVALSDGDGRRFAANSFQIRTAYYGERTWVLLMPDGLTEGLYSKIRRLGVIPCPVDVSEFLEKGGGAVKCMLLNLGGA